MHTSILGYITYSTHDVGLICDVIYLKLAHGQEVCMKTRKKEKKWLKFLHALYFLIHSFILFNSGNMAHRTHTCR